MLAPSLLSKTLSTAEGICNADKCLLSVRIVSGSTYSSDTKCIEELRVLDLDSGFLNPERLGSMRTNGFLCASTDASRASIQSSQLRPLPRARLRFGRSEIREGFRLRSATTKKRHVKSAANNDRTNPLCYVGN